MQHCPLTPATTGDKVPDGKSLTRAGGGFNQPLAVQGQRQRLKPLGSD